MKNLINFIFFISYTTLIFLLPNNILILSLFIFHIAIIIFLNVNIKSIISGMIKIFPFILFTFIINMLIDNFYNALWIGIKLILVCNITFIYSKTLSTASFAKTIKLLCSPLKIFHINTDDIEIMICISLSMIYVLKSNLDELKDSCKSKYIKFNISNLKFIFSKLFLSLIRRINQIEESLISKGF